MATQYHEKLALGWWFANWVHVFSSCIRSHRPVELTLTMTNEENRLTPSALSAHALRSSRRIVVGRFDRHYAADSGIS
jgi:hypothetical protein